MNKIIRNVPVELLPQDWRQGLPTEGVVEVELRVKPSETETAKLADLVGSAPNVHGSIEDTVRHIRRLRGDD